MKIFSEELVAQAVKELNIADLARLPADGYRFLSKKR